MHELSICDSIARAVITHAGGRQVRSVRLRVGALRQVVPETLVFCWSIAGRGPLLEGSVLQVDLVPGEIECRDCGARSLLTRCVLQCPACGGTVFVVAGEELLVVSIDVVDDPIPAPPIAGDPPMAGGPDIAGGPAETITSTRE